MRRLFTYALAAPIILQPKRRILEVKDIKKYVFNAETDYGDPEYYRNNWMTYESILPKYVDKNTARHKMLKDLNLMLGVHGRIEPRMKFCWVISRTNDFKDTRKMGISLSSLITIPFNSRPDMPFVVDDTGDGHRQTGIHEPLPLGLSIEEYNQMLRPHGYQLTAESKLLDMFVLTDASNSKAE